MSLGLGIFLSTLMVGLLLLYRWTMDRWSWGRPLRRLSIGIVLVALIGGASLLAFTAYTNRSTAQTSYYGVALGMTKDEVRYELGQPSNVTTPGDLTGAKPWERYSEVVPVGKIPGDKQVEDYHSWSYDGPPRIDIDFDTASGKVISVGCYAGDAHCNNVLTLSDGTSEHDVVERLGDPSKEQIDGATKIMSYRKLNLELYLTKEKVYMVKVRQFAVP